MIRLGTRSSPLAMRQAHIAAARITERSGRSVEIVPFSSLGDEDQVRPLARFLRPGAFTGRLDQALQTDEVDVAIHSLKDVPLRAPEGVSRTYVLERADPADRLVLAPDLRSDDLASRRVGTSAPRRQSQLGARHPDAVAVDVRGSIGTRIRRIEDGELDALFVAAAALDRGQDRLPEGATVRRLSLRTWPTAPGQGALALQAKEGTEAETLLQQIEDPAVAGAVAVERGLLADLGGGCGTPLGATCLPPGHAEGDADRWTLHVTYPTDSAQTLHMVTLHDDDPHACRQRALQTIVRPSGDQHRPAKGADVLLVMDHETGTPWRDALDRAGWRTVHWWPFTTIDLTATDPTLLDRAATAFAAADWVLATSARAVPLCARLHQETGALPRFAVVGPATARALRAAGLPVTLVPPSARGEALVRQLSHRAAKDEARRVFWPSGTDVTHETEEALGRTDLHVDRIPVYRVEPTTPPPLPHGRFAAALFTSPRVIQHALPLLGHKIADTLYAIGPATAAALTATEHPAVVLPHPTPTALIERLRQR